MTARGREVEIPLFSKAPFANYDIVVYLGGGVFALLVFWRYAVVPFDLFENLEFFGTSAEDSWVAQAIFLIGGVIVAYTVGHLVAYLSSHFVEGFINRSLGSFSEIIKRSTLERDKFDAKNQRAILKNLKANFSPNNAPLIWFAHAPVGIWYWIMVQFCLFDSIDTRIPKRMIKQLKTRLMVEFEEVRLKDKRQWFRWVEYTTYYNAPIASASMYNYLVISGFMRSISVILLGAIWFEVGHLIYFDVTGKSLIHVNESALKWAVHVALVYLGFICAMTAYTKFYRRYVEEAILGFLLEIPPRK